MSKGSQAGNAEPENVPLTTGARSEAAARQTVGITDINSLSPVLQLLSEETRGGADWHLIAKGATNITGGGKVGASSETNIRKKEDISSSDTLSRRIIPSGCFCSPAHAILNNSPR